MKQNQPSSNSITESLLKQLMECDKANAQRLPSIPSISSQPSKAAEFDQDAGGGYNPDGTFPQA